MGTEKLPEQVLALYSKSKSKWTRDQIELLIKQTGGTLPAKEEGVQEEYDRHSAEGNANAQKELQEIIDSLSNETMGKDVLARKIERIGEIGNTEDVMPIIKRLQKPNTHWVVKQNAYSVLGKLGGDDAIKYLLEELRKPLPADAKRDDYGDTEAVLRAQAALALGECGGPDIIGILTDYAENSKQYQRVRQACRKAMSQINGRLEKGENGDVLKAPINTGRR